MAIRKAGLVGSVFLTAALGKVADFGEDPRDFTCMADTLMYWDEMGCNVFDHSPQTCIQLPLYYAEDACDATGCKVVFTNPSGNSTCSEYCMGHGLQCLSASETSGDGGCAEGGQLSCQDTSVNKSMICECGGTPDPNAALLGSLSMEMIAPYCYALGVNWRLCMEEKYESQDPDFFQTRMAEAFPVLDRSRESSFISHKGEVMDYGSDPRDASCAPHHIMWSQMGCEMFDGPMPDCNGGTLYFAEEECGGGCKVQVGGPYKNMSCTEYCQSQGFECVDGSEGTCSSSSSIGCFEVSKSNNTVCTCGGVPYKPAQASMTAGLAALAPPCMERLRGYGECLHRVYEDADQDFYTARAEEVRPLYESLESILGEPMPMPKCVNISKHLAEELDALLCSEGK